MLVPVCYASSNTPRRQVQGRKWPSRRSGQRGAARKIDSTGIFPRFCTSGLGFSKPPVLYLVGTPKGRLAKLEQALLGLPWQAVRQGVDMKLLPQGQEVYVLAQSRTRIHKERAMRRRHLKRLWVRLVDVEATFKRTSRTISAFDRSTTGWGNASRRTYSLHSWPIAST